MCLPLATSVVLWFSATRLGRWLPPATAVRLLTAAALVTALATGFMLAVAAFDAAAQLPPVAALGHWSAAAVRTGGEMSAMVGALAGLTVSVLLGAALRRTVRCGWDLALAARTCRRLGPGVAGLVVVEDEHPDAYAVPGVRGRVVVSTAMLRALPGQERRVLLAHENAHLAHRHHLYVQLAGLSAAANPLLRPLAVAVRAGVERWADEVAAAEVGDRHLAARALARAGLARTVAASRHAPMPAIALGAVDGGVGARARALLAAPPRRRRGLAGALTALVLLTLSAAAHTAYNTEHRFEQAQAAYLATR
jgi:hypothetical protein